MTTAAEPSRQELIDQLRIDLAQATIDLAEVRVNDLLSRQAKEKVHEGLRKINGQLNGLGLCHSLAQKCRAAGA